MNQKINAEGFIVVDDIKGQLLIVADRLQILFKSQLNLETIQSMYLNPMSCYLQRAKSRPISRL